MSFDLCFSFLCETNLQSFDAASTYIFATSQGGNFVIFLDIVCKRIIVISFVFRDATSISKSYLISYKKNFKIKKKQIKVKVLAIKNINVTLDPVQT